MTTSPAGPGPDDRPTAPQTSPATDLAPAQRALAEAVVEIERHVASGGWDGPVRVFALVGTQSALDAQPALAGQLPPEVLSAAAADPHHLTAIEQAGRHASDDLEETGTAHV